MGKKAQLPLTKGTSRKRKSASNMLYGLAGEYAVCAELCRRGILALPTPKNNPIFDIAAIDPTTFVNVAIQVKTMSPENKQGWKLGPFNEQSQAVDNLFVILVRLNENTAPDFYIWDYSTFRDRVNAIFERYMKKPKRDGSPHKNPGIRWFDLKDFQESDKDRKDAWQLLGLSIDRTPQYLLSKYPLDYYRLTSPTMNGGPPHPIISVKINTW